MTFFFEVNANCAENGDLINYEVIVTIEPPRGTYAGEQLYIYIKKDDTILFSGNLSSNKLMSRWEPGTPKRLSAGSVVFSFLISPALVKESSVNYHMPSSTEGPDCGINCHLHLSAFQKMFEDAIKTNSRPKG